MPALQIACGYLQKPANLNQAELYIAWEAITKVFIYGEGFGSSRVCAMNWIVLYYRDILVNPFCAGGRVHTNVTR